MPLYEFECNSCNEDFEELLLGKDFKPQCPHCQSLDVKKLISAHGGYSMNSGGGSTRPKSAGSFKRSKK